MNKKLVDRAVITRLLRSLGDLSPAELTKLKRKWLPELFFGCRAQDLCTSSPHRLFSHIDCAWWIGAIHAQHQSVPKRRLQIVTRLNPAEAEMPWRASACDDRRRDIGVPASGEEGCTPGGNATF